MQDSKQRIRESFGDISPSELAEILQVAVKKSLHGKRLGISLYGSTTHYLSG
ncbi:hypothetical protein I2J92_003019 [Listeria monocytogenes]|nr:hypothetical protein [Listeria monocytogenes]